MSESHAPIIIKKRIIVKGGGHHGGAWKVAYADFVTAMMAFFLLMWLLNATTEEQRKGLADFFDPSVPMARISGGGNDVLSGASIFTDDALAEDGIGASERFAPQRLTPTDGINEDRAELDRIEKEINARKDAIADDNLAQHIQTRMTPDGLLVELIDQERAPLFEIGSAKPSSLLQKLLQVVAPVLSSVENDIEVIGHTDSRAYSNNTRYSNWELSADRANIARRMLIENRLQSAQIIAVIGKADMEPIVADPMASQNRRISILLKTVRHPPAPSASMGNSAGARGLTDAAPSPDGL